MLGLDIMCDGKYHGERFFRCAAGFGQYIPLEDAEVLGEDDLLYSSPRPAPAPEPEPTRGSAQAQAPVVSPVSADRSESVVIPLGFGAGSLGGGPGSASEQEQASDIERTITEAFEKASEA